MYRLINSENENIYSLKDLPVVSLNFSSQSSSSSQFMKPMSSLTKGGKGGILVDAGLNFLENFETKSRHVYSWKNYFWIRTIIIV